MLKKTMVLLTIITITICCAGCSTSQTTDIEQSNNQQYAKVEVYSATDNSLIKTIEDEKLLDEFVTNISIDEKDLSENEQAPENAEAKYKYVVYKKPVAVTGSNDLEEVMSFTTYTDSNFVLEQVAPDVVKNMPLSKDTLSFGMKLSDEAIDYLNDLVE